MATGTLRRGWEAHPAMDKILVIDDEVVIRKLLRELLDKEGYTVLTASSGEKGIGIMVKEHPALILLDLKMPGIDGIETLRRIRELDPRVVVIVITGYGTPEAAAEAMQLGAHDFISKPFDIMRIRVSVRNVHEIQRLAFEVEKAKSIS